MAAPGIKAPQLPEGRRSRHPRDQVDELEQRTHDWDGVGGRRVRRRPAPDRIG